QVESALCVEAVWIACAGQSGSPFESITPPLFSSMRRLFSLGAGPPLVLEMSPPTETEIGADPDRGRRFGLKEPETLTLTSPFWAISAVARVQRQSREARLIARVFVGRLIGGLSCGCGWGGAAFAFGASSFGGGACESGMGLEQHPRSLHSTPPEP